MAERALLIRLGALGDTLQASSVAALLKKGDPRTEVDFLATAGLEDLFRMIPSVRRGYGLPFRRIPFRGHPWWRAMADRLNEAGYTLAYLMETNRRFLPLLEGVRADRKVTLTEHGRGDAYPSDVPNPVRYQRALWDAGLAPREIVPPEMVVGEEEERRAAGLLESLGLDPEAPLVGIHAGNSYQARQVWRRKLGRTDLRSWPEARWGELVARFHEANDQIRFVLFGGPRDRRANARIAEDLRRTVPAVSLASTAGRTDLALAAALLKRLSLFVSTDTGPLHMAAALRVPFVGLYGPTRFEETQPFTAGPVGAVLRRSLPCQPCYGTPNQRRCRNNVCMQRIEAGEVVAKALELNPALFAC